MASVGSVVLPGDVVSIPPKDGTSKPVIGPGLRLQNDSVIATKPGVVQCREPGIYWIDSHQKRYVPARGDSVIGIVTAKAGDTFRVDIGTSETATLSYLAFESATKRNRPDVKVGDLVYAKLVVANKDMEPELVCIDGNGKSSGMGVIHGGYMIQTSISLARKLLSSKDEVIQQIGKTLPYEIAVGLNGRIWINGRQTKETLAIADAITAAEFMDRKQVKDMVRRLNNALSGF